MELIYFTDENRYEILHESSIYIFLCFMLLLSFFKRKLKHYKNLRTAKTHLLVGEILLFYVNVDL